VTGPLSAARTWVEKVFSTTIGPGRNDSLGHPHIVRTHGGSATVPCNRSGQQHRLQPLRSGTFNFSQDRTGSDLSSRRVPGTAQERDRALRR
jgi:hypothetical protein